MQFIAHYTLHLIFPAIIAFVFFKNRWKKVYLILLLTLLIDADHLLVLPIYDPERCSIGFHFLHSFYVIPIYLVLVFFKRTRIVAIGLLFHIITDLIDCLWIYSKSGDC